VRELRVPLLEPFKGLRYDPSAVSFDQVIAPPYDVIGPAERSRLASRSRANAVHVELPQPDLQGGLDRYEVAARLLRSWRADGVIRQDPTPCLYPYRMTLPDGRSSVGVIGALDLGEPGEETDILPHEETLPKPRSDRLDLLRATHANLSPIWGLSLTESMTQTIPTMGPAAVDAFDDDGVRHELWVVDDPTAISDISAAVGASPLVIADGHHRYETARNYQRERREQGGNAAGEYDQIMTLVVELSEDQLMVGPIHRTIGDLPERTDLLAAFAKWFDVVRAGPYSDHLAEALGESSSLALLTTEDAWLLTPRPEAYKEADSDLDSSVVSLVLKALPEHTDSHRHSWQEAVESLTGGAAQAAVLLRPVTVAQIAEWADNRRRMPPKTTYFSPKPRTGMVFRTLED